MKILKSNRLGVFTNTFLFGVIAVFAFFTISQFDFGLDQVEASRVEVIRFSQMKPDATTEIEKFAEPKLEDLKIDLDDELKEYSVDLLLTGDFHGDEVNAKSGQVWLGLFIENGSSYLAHTEIKVTSVRDELVDKEKELKTGKKVSVVGRGEPLFLLRNAANVKPGKAKTLFNSAQTSESSDDENNRITTGFRRDFILNGEKYALKVETDSSKKEGDELFRVILIVNGIEQTVHWGRNSDNWYLNWVGDIDNDGKLDFLVDLSHHYNVSNKKLFLSGNAVKRKLVKEAAGFRTVGC